MIRRPPRSTQSRSSAASDVYKRQHSRRVCAGADRTRLPDVVRTVGLRATTEVVPLDGALEPLALAHADGGDGLTVLESLDGDGIADLEIAGTCLLYTSDAADDLLCVDLGGRRIIKKKKNKRKR